VAFAVYFNYKGAVYVCKQLRPSSSNVYIL